MSDKMPMYAVDKCRIKVNVPVEVKVKLESLAEETGLSVSALAAAEIEEMVKDRPFGAQELMRVNEIISENIRKRDALKAKKGVR